MGGPHHRHKREHTQHAEPIRLPVRRGNGELQGIALLVPHTAVVAGDDAEAVGARSEGSSTARWRSLTDLSPVIVLPLQLVLEMNLLRRDKAQSGVVDLQVTNPAAADVSSKLQCRPLSSANKVLWSATICSMRTGGGSLLTAR